MQTISFAVDDLSERLESYKHDGDKGKPIKSPLKPSWGNNMAFDVFIRPKAQNDIEQIALCYHNQAKEIQETKYGSPSYFSD